MTRAQIFIPLNGVCKFIDFSDISHNLIVAIDIKTE